MAVAKDNFDIAIQDAENLLKHFDKLNPKSGPPPNENEVLKRAGLVMAMTAWETYVEDRLREGIAARLAEVADQKIAELVRDRLEAEIKRLNNPDYKRTSKLFADFAAVQLAEHWQWNGFDRLAVRDKLNGYLKLRGDIVHRSRVVKAGPPVPHPVNREDLKKVISFLRNLVDATEAAFVTQSN
jgi:hypothetical protein